MTTKERLHTLIDRLDDAEANELLEYADWLSQESDTLTEDEFGRARAGQEAIARGDYVALETLRQETEGYAR